MQQERARVVTRDIHDVFGEHIEPSTYLIRHTVALGFPCGKSKLFI
jgi:hypothetical protein